MNETQIGQLVIDLEIRLEGVEKGLQIAREKLQEIEQENVKVQNSNSQLETSFTAMTDNIMAAMVKMTSAVSKAVDSGVQKYNSYVNSMSALQKTVKATNNSMTEIENTIKDVNKLKLMDDSDVTAATKNLLTYGFTAEQTGDILKVLQDAAVGNRQESYSLSEAVRVTTEGIRMENSVLSDAAGIQKNISKMYEEYAQEIGKTTDSLTQAEKAQAVYNGIMNEATMFTGSAIEMAKGYQGQQAQLNATNLELSRTIGEIMLPALVQYKSLQLSLTQGLASFVKEHRGATTGLITFTTTIVTMVEGLKKAKKAYDSYKAAVEASKMTTEAFTIALLKNPVTLIAVGIAAVVAGLFVYNTKMQETIDKMDEMAEKSRTVVESVQNFFKNDFSLTEGEKDVIEQRKNECEEVVKIYEEKKNKIKAIEDEIVEIQKSDKLSFQKKRSYKCKELLFRKCKKGIKRF